MTAENAENSCDPYTPEFCLERAVVYGVTQDNRHLPHRPPSKSHGKDHDGARIIFDHELIVGNPTSKRVAAPILPEVAWKGT